MTEGRVVTFYGYKGGTGRTMALANTAWILASNGLKVLAVDWDLDSPGLHRYFHPFLSPDEVAVTPGIIEMVTDYALAATRDEPRAANWHVTYARILQHAVSLNWVFPEGGTLDFVSPGRQNRDYAAAVTAIDWDNFYERLGGDRFLDALRADMKANYDYTLIDSRTGLSDSADICTVHFPEILVDCFTLSHQSIEGASAVARTVGQRYRRKNIRILPVPMRVEEAERDKLDAGRALARRCFRDFPRGMSVEEASRYWGSVEIPYKTFYAFEEILAAFGDAPGRPASLLAAYERLTAAITQGQVTALSAIPEEIRLMYLNAFTRRRDVARLSGEPAVPQYEALEAVHERFRDQGFAVLGFPAKDFGGQEPGTNEEISEFCSATIGVQFPMFAKIAVTCQDKHSLYTELTSARPEAEGDKAAFRANLQGYGMTPTEDPEILWNFEKFLLSRDGAVVARFSPDVTPDDERSRPRSSGSSQVEQVAVPFPVGDLCVAGMRPGIGLRAASLQAVRRRPDSPDVRPAKQAKYGQ